MSLVLKSDFVIDAASIGGSEHPNQDAWGKRDAFFWVLDGATAPNTSSELSVADYVASLNDSLYRSAISERSLQDVLRAALESVKSHPASEAGFTATVAMAKKIPTGWEWLVLGDAAVVYGSPHGDFRLESDQRLGQVAASLRGARNAVRGNPATAAQFNELTAALRREEARWRNVPGGFWVAGADPNAARQALEGTVDGGVSMFLLTDGVTDGLDSTHWSSLDAAVADWTTQGVTEALKTLRETLLARYGRMDDATLVSIRHHA